MVGRGSSASCFSFRAGPQKFWTYSHFFIVFCLLSKKMHKALKVLFDTSLEILQMTVVSTTKRRVSTNKGKNPDVQLYAARRYDARIQMECNAGALP